MKRSDQPSVLIVEDVEEMRDLLKQLVSAIPEVRVSGVAKSVWEGRLELTRRRPDLVLLDEILPGESSGDLLMELQGQGIPVVLITGMEEPSHALPAGAASRVGKPSWETLERDRERIRAAILEALSS